MEKKYRVIFLIILLIGIFVRVYKLYDVPKGIHIDEIGMFLDANMLAKYKTDRYGHNYPVYLQNYGGGQSVMYSYITSFLINIFSSSYLLIRIPSLFFGILLIIFSYLIGREFLSKKQSLLLMSLVAFCPYFIQSSRIGLDCNLLLPIFTIAIYVLIKAIKNNKNILFLLSGILFSISLYTYAISYIIIPLFVIITFIYLIKNKQVNQKNIISFITPLFLLAIPIILFLLVNYNLLPEFKLFKTDLYKLPIFRNSEISIKNILNNIFIFPVLTFDYYEYNATMLFGTIYYISIPFFIIGIIKYIKKIKTEKEFNMDIILFIALISCYIAFLFIENLNVNKANAIYFLILYFTNYGIINCSNKIKKTIIILYLINIITFPIYYFYLNKYNEYNDPYFDNNIKKIIDK